MINEDYCSFEVAKLLKEKGFNEPCHACYAYFSDDDIRVFDFKYSKATQSLNENRYQYVSIYVAMRWLREVHNLFIQITIDFSDGAYPMYNVCVVNLAICTSIVVNGHDRYSYEEAVEAAIKYCLENLI